MWTQLRQNGQILTHRVAVKIVERNSKPMFCSCISILMPSILIPISIVKIKIKLKSTAAYLCYLITSLDFFFFDPKRNENVYIAKINYNANYFRLFLSY